MKSVCVCRGVFLSLPELGAPSADAAGTVELAVVLPRWAFSTSSPRFLLGGHRLPRQSLAGRTWKNVQPEGETGLKFNSKLTPTKR